MKNISLSNKSEFGKIIGKKLITIGKNQKYLAKRLDISAASLSNMLTGKYTPSAERIYSISKLLDLDIDLLIKSIYKL